ncbi:MAG: hypothetical protein ACLTZE_03075 [Evtepia sp.]
MISPETAIHFAVIPASPAPPKKNAINPQKDGFGGLTFPKSLLHWVRPIDFSA